MKGLEICIFKLIIFIDFKPQITKIIEILVHFRFVSGLVYVCQVALLISRTLKLRYFLKIRAQLNCTLSVIVLVRTLAPIYISFKKDLKQMRE